ncbi:hypothetical protein [Neorhizobium petrolearium]|uniref:hypothetical protein n=1 Tax=Neorhizobium petrolearium TaxID=515361 RepID=UPI003F153E77
MFNEAKFSTQNNLLRLLAPEELELFSPDLVACDLPKGLVLAAYDEPIEHVYFPDSGIHLPGAY